MCERLADHTLYHVRSKQHEGKLHTLAEHGAEPPSGITIQPPTALEQIWDDGPACSEDDHEAHGCGDGGQLDRANQHWPARANTDFAFSWRRRSFHQGQISPKVLQTVRAAEKRGEVRSVHEDEVATALLIRRHTEETIELGVTRCGERMRTV